MVRAIPHYVAAVRSRLLALTIAAAVAIAACGSDDDAATTATGTTVETAPQITDAVVDTTEAPVDAASPTTESAPETTEPVLTELASFEPGPYDVGVQTITINADSDRPLTVEVWFPVDGWATAPAYEYTLPAGGVLRIAVCDRCRSGGDRHRRPVPARGVLARFSSCCAILYTNFAEAIASAGYVVAAPDHTGNTVFDLFARDRRRSTRPMPSTDRSTFRQSSRR